MSKKSEGDTYLNRRDDDARRGAFFLAPDDLSDGFRSSSSLSAHQSFIVWCASQWGAARRARRVIGRRVADESLRFSRDATTKDANGRRMDTDQQGARTDPVSFLDWLPAPQHTDKILVSSAWFWLLVAGCWCCGCG